MKYIGGKNRHVCHVCGRVLHDGLKYELLRDNNNICLDCYLEDLDEYLVLSLERSEIDALGYDSSKLTKDEMKTLARRLKENLLIDQYWDDLDKELLAIFSEKKGRKA